MCQLVGWIMGAKTVQFFEGKEAGLFTCIYKLSTRLIFVLRIRICLPDTLINPNPQHKTYAEENQA